MSSLEGGTSRIRIESDEVGAILDVLVNEVLLLLEHLEDGELQLGSLVCFRVLSSVSGYLEDVISFEIWL